MTSGHPEIYTTLTDVIGESGSRTQDAMFMKTPLWKAALQLDTGRMMSSAPRH